MKQAYETADVKPRVGSYVEIDGHNLGECLLEGDEPFGGWAGCQFRWPNPVLPWQTKHAIACDVTITGSTLQRRHGGLYVRVKVVWVQDGEPNTNSRGWILADERART